MFDAQELKEVSNDVRNHLGQQELRGTLCIAFLELLSGILWWSRLLLLQISLLWCLPVVFKNHSCIIVLELLHFIFENLRDGLLVQEADLLDDVDPKIWLVQLVTDLEDELSELEHHHFGKVFVVDLGGKEAHGVREAAEEFGAELCQIGHKEFVQPSQEQLQS